MITYEKREAVGQAAQHVVARVVLADGHVAGTGFGPTEAVAARFACDDACRSLDGRDRTAGQGHRPGDQRR